MKREEKIVIRRFIVIAMVGMLLVTPSQGEADSSSKSSRREVTDSSQRNKTSVDETSGDECVAVAIKGGALVLPQDVLRGVLQNISDAPTASMFYFLLLQVKTALGQERVSFLVDADGFPKKAFPGPNCGGNSGSGNGINQTAIAPIEF